jgi:general L-amino acid transport system permease protein
VAETVETPQVEPAEESPVLTEDPLTQPAATPGEWLRANLFSTWYNALFTVVFGAFLGYAFFRLLLFVFVTANWEIVRVNLTTFMVGRFPRGELYRAWVAIGLVSAVSGLGVGVAARRRGRANRVALLRMAAPGIVFVAVLLALTSTATPALMVALSALVALGSRTVGMRLPPRVGRYMPILYVATVFGAYAAFSAGSPMTYNNFQGLLLNVFLAIAAITLCFPFGVLLALGRRSTFPAVRLVCVGYIELIRGVPLITLLLMGATMLGFFVPAGMTRPGQVTRALVAFVLFAGAYVAEDVRGGLQSIPPGQVEAAKAIGLSPLKTTLLIVLPQALRNVIPALVGQFISLTKDTVLVAIIGLTDVLRVARAVTSQPQFAGQGLQAETLLFTGFLLWSICFTMSRASQRLEKRLGVGMR